MRKSILILLLGILTLGLFATEAVQDSLKTEETRPQITFLEFGSTTCIPCKQMVPIMKAIEEEYSDKVLVKFIDVRKEINKQLSREYKIRAIPTQVFLDASGKEVSRHQGFFPKEEIVKVLEELGVTND